MKRLLTSTEVAKQLGISRPSLIVLLHRHPQLRPAIQLPAGDFLWTNGEIKRVIDHRATRKRGRPAKHNV